MDSNLPPNPPPIPPPAPATPPPPPPPQPVFSPSMRAAPPPRSNRGLKAAVIILAIILAFSLLWNASSLFTDTVGYGVAHTQKAGPELIEGVIENNHSTSKILVVPVEGVISSDGFDASGYNLVEYITDQLELAERDDRVKAVVLKVNSPGGEVLASDDIYNALVDFQKKTSKPVVASMGSLAASGGYYVSAPCQWIVANELTITGSIGVIIQTFNFRGLMDKVGVRPEVYKSGKFKDMLSGMKRENEITDEERAMVQDMVNQTFEKFKEVVAKGRKAANSANESEKDKGRKLKDDWADLADGRVLSGKEAFEAGLVDELGNFEIAVKRAQKLANISNANLIRYQQQFDFSSLFRLFGKSEKTKVQVDLGLDLPKIKAGYMYFLPPTFIH
jgi:protease IV